MATSSAEVKRVRFNIEGKESKRGDEQWDFLKYLLTLREEFNVTSVVDNLVQKGIISADTGTDVMRLGNTRAQIELCVQEVMKGGPPAFVSLCEILQELGYSNIVDALKTDGMSEIEVDDLQCLGTRPKDQQLWSPGSSVVRHDEHFAVKGKKMALSALARDTKATQREFSVIVERQQELEKQLVQVMRSLDTAKDMLIRERQEKLGLKEQLKNRDDELKDMQRKYLELQKAMGNLRETNNKYHEKVTRLQIENEQLRQSAKDKLNIQAELEERSREISRLKETLEKQDKQMTIQDEHIVKKLDIIEQVVNDHKGLTDGQEKLMKKVSIQATEISRLSEEKHETQNQMAAQQRQLNFQHAQIVMLQEHMQRIEGQLNTGRASEPPSSDMHLPGIPGTPVNDPRGSRYIGSISKGLSLKPFITQGKPENSKNSYWRGDPAGKKYK